jgi:hypothetical protein
MALSLDTAFARPPRSGGVDQEECIAERKRKALFAHDLVGGALPRV